MFLISDTLFKTFQSNFSKKTHQHKPNRTNEEHIFYIPQSVNQITSTISYKAQCWPCWVFCLWVPPVEPWAAAPHTIPCLPAVPAVTSHRRHQHARWGSYTPTPAENIMGELKVARWVLKWYSWSSQQKHYAYINPSPNSFFLKMAILAKFETDAACMIFVSY